MVEQIIIHFLYLSAGQLVKLYVAETRDDVFCEVPVVVVRGALANVWFGVDGQTGAKRHRCRAY